MAKMNDKKRLFKVLRKKKGEAEEKLRVLETQREDLEKEKTHLIEEELRRELNRISQIIKDAELEHERHLYSIDSLIETFETVEEKVKEIRERIVNKILSVIKKINKLSDQISEIEGGIENIQGTIDFLKKQEQVPVQEKSSQKEHQNLPEEKKSQIIKKSGTYKEIVELILNTYGPGKTKEIIERAISGKLIPDEEKTKNCLATVLAELSREGKIRREGEKPYTYFLLKQEQC